MIERIFPDPAVLSASALEHELLVPPPERGRAGTPWVSFNFISSIDGAASVEGRSGQLGNAWDQRVFSLLRQSADVIVVGAQTIRSEGYGGELLSKTAQKWREENWLSAHPPLAIVSGTLNLDTDLEVFQNTPVRPLILTLESAPKERREALSEVAEVITVGTDSMDVPLVISELAARGFTQIHSEGGPTLLGTFAAAGKVDELCLTISPMLVGGSAGRIASGPAVEHVSVAAGMTLTRIMKADSMLFLRYVRPTVG
ncbi:pyrimidine reductase family protein [Arthrobacter sp. E3]|uniref:pyrimidine reductase family protein n=1 Tax=Arthrobacter sp. E3 TaxID=517402 RepID=UPI001A946527|nr:pyrimidine reductase family protein [Arthrobacter sp. E3]